MSRGAAPTPVPLASPRRTGVPDARTLAGGAAGAAVLCYALLLLDDEQVETIVASEAGVVENLGALSLLGASILLAVAHRRSRRRAHLVFALALFVGAGEELAWGQHVLGLTAPDPVRRWNAQDEITLHNLDFIQDLRHSVGYDIVLAAFAVVAAGYFVAAPVLAARSPRARIAIDRCAPIPPGVFGAVLVMNFALLALVGVLSSSDRAHAATETAEAGLALVLLAFAIDAVVTARRPLT